MFFFPVYRHKHRQIYTDTHTHTHTFAVDNFFCSFKYNCNHRWIHFFIIHFLLWGIVTLLCSVSFSSLAKWISYTHIHIACLLDFPPTWPPSHPSRSPQSTKLSSLCYTAGSHQPSVLHMAEHACESHSPNSSHPTAVSTHPFSFNIHFHSLHSFF